MSWRALILTLLPWVAHAGIFQFPPGFDGLWRGVPDTSAMGPWAEPLIFGLSAAPNGDYLLGQDIDLNPRPTAPTVGWQHFYVEGSGSWAGRLWYCGEFLWNHDPELAGGEMPPAADTFMAQPVTAEGKSVSFCFNSSIPVVPRHAAPGCTGCSCANWTLSLMDDNTLSSSMIIAGSSNHLLVTFKRAGKAPRIERAMPAHSGTFCNFSTFDGHPNNFSTPSPQHSGCPFMRPLAPTTAARVPNPPHPAAAILARDPAPEFEHCFQINDLMSYQLEWKLEQNSVRIRISAKIEKDGYVALGFRPMSRSRDPSLVAVETGNENLFGMRGADMVIGHAAGAKVMYGSQFVGSPDPTGYLEIQNVTSSYQDSRLAVTFTRPLVGGKLHSVYGMNASILSPWADTIFAVGDFVGGWPTFHGYNRGLRLVDWVDPSPLNPLKCQPS